MRIKELLKSKNVTQQELADRLNISLSAVKQMVGASSLTTATLEKISNALDVPMWQFFVDPAETSGFGEPTDPVTEELRAINQRLTRIEELLSKAQENHG